MVLRSKVPSLQNVGGKYIQTKYCNLGSTLLACRAVARPHVELEICITQISYKCERITVPTTILFHFLQQSVNMQTCLTKNK